MSFWVAGAVVLSSVVGAGSAKNSADKAQAGQEKGLSASIDLQNQAKQEAKDYFGIGARSSQAGFQSALDFLKSTQAAKISPMIQSNVAGQKIIGQGAQQANNAILGLPVDMSFANKQYEVRPNYQPLYEAKLPILGGQQGNNPISTRDSATEAMKNAVSSSVSNIAVPKFQYLLGSRN